MAEKTLKLVGEFLEQMNSLPPPRTFEEHWERWIAFRRHYEEFTRALLEEQTESPIEAILYLHLRDWMVRHPVLVETQVQILNYRVDFLISTHDKKVVVECDGHDFHEKTKQQAARDKKRDRDLVKQGYIVLRYTGSEIWNDVYKVIQELEHVLFGEEE